MRFKAGHITFLFLLVIILVNSSCKKQRILTTGGNLLFSVDTLNFDTVFTAAGSFTTGLVIYNPQNEEVILSSVKLQNGAGSYFHLNVDGFPGNNIPNLRIAAHDSLYVFATVNINPSDTLTPFIVTDSLVATLNGKNFYIPFQAYGQNAHYEVSDSIKADTTWLTDKPYVIIHSCVVGPNATLTIPGGCRVYMHQDARIFVYGTMSVDPTGTPGMDSVVFQGDRLDRSYFNYMGYPGEWGGFYFIGSGGTGPGGIGYIRNAVIKNCGGSTPYYSYGIQSAAIEADSGAQLTIDHSIIENAIGWGIFSDQGNVTATSCLVTQTGQEALAIVQGGYDSITNCTFANYGTFALTHVNYGTAVIYNYLITGPNSWISGNLNGIMRNCIVYGSLDSEIICDSLGGATASFRLDHCILKMGNVHESFVNFTSDLYNQDPMFKDPTNGVCTLMAGSPAIGAGNASVPGIVTPLYGGTWDSSGAAIDIGCY